MNKQDNDFITLSKPIITNHQLSAESLAVICYLMAKYGLECKINKEEVRVRFGWGNHTWYRVSRELKLRGFVNEVISNKGSQLYFSIASATASADYLDAYLESTEVEDGQL